MNKKTDLDVDESGRIETEKNRALLQDFINASERQIQILSERCLAILPMYQELLKKEDLSASDLAEVLARSRNEFPMEGDSYTKIFEQLPEEQQSRWEKIVKFLRHDITHLSESSIYAHAEKTVVFLSGQTEGEPFRPDLKVFYQKAIRELPDIFMQLQYPHQFMKGLAELELHNEVSGIEPIDFKKKLGIMARMIQLTFFNDDYEIKNPYDREFDRNEIILDLEPSKLKTHSGMLWSIMWNLMKNAAKEMAFKGSIKISPRIKRLMDQTVLPEKPSKIYIRTENLDQENITMIHVADSGGGIKTFEIMDCIKEIIKQNISVNSGVSNDMRRAIKGWKENPYIIRSLTLGSIFDLAGLPKISGFQSRENLSGEYSSGMGLWGVNYLAKSIGSEIIFTNMAEGGALFTLIIPNDFFNHTCLERKAIQKNIADVRRKLKSGGILIKVPNISN